MSAVTWVLGAFILVTPVLVVVGTVVGELIVRALPASWKDED